MHLYIFDYFLGQKKYEKTVAAIETRLTDLGLQGKNCHVGPLKSLKSIVRDELRATPTTIVAVGNNTTLSGVINALAGVDVAVGIIPVGPDNSLAKLLGITDEDGACGILSARLIERINVGLINNYRFIARAAISNQGSVLEINGAYTVEPAGPGETSVVNLATRNTLGVQVQTQKKGLFKAPVASADATFIQTGRVIANNLAGHDFVVDDAVHVKPPATFSVQKQALSLIVGRERQF